MSSKSSQPLSFVIEKKVFFVCDREQKKKMARYTQNRAGSPLH